MSDQDTAPPIEPSETAAPDRGLSLLYGDKSEPDPAPKAEGGEGVEPEGEGAVPPDTSAEGDPEPSGSGEGDEVKEQTVTSLSELIESQEWDQEWFDGLKVPIKVDGETSEVSFKDLVSGFRMNAAADKRLEEAKAKVKAVNEEVARHNEEAQKLIGIGSKLIKRAEDALTSEMGAVDWTRLKEDDPAEYSARRLDFQERRATIEQWKAEARQEIEEASRRIQEGLQSQIKDSLDKQHELFIQKHPESGWDKPESRAKLDLRMTQYLRAEGFQDQEIAELKDARAWSIVYKALQHDETREKVQTPLKKVVKVPKVMKPGVKATQPNKPKPKNAAEILYGTG